MTVKVEKQNPGEYRVTGHGQRFWLHHADSRFVIQDLDEKTSIEIKPELLPALLLAIGETVAEFYELDPTAPVTRQTGFSHERERGEICPPDFTMLEELEGLATPGASPAAPTGENSIGNGEVRCSRTS